MEFVELVPGVQWREATSRPRIPKTSNIYLLDGGILVEPTVNFDDELSQVISFAKERNVKYVLVTHTHPDHLQRVDEVAQALGVPILGPRELKRGETLETWVVFDAPGHDDLHIVLWDGYTLILGDAHVGGTGWEHERFETVEFLAALDPRTACPSHGRPFLKYSFRKHWRHREGEVPWD